MGVVAEVRAGLAGAAVDAFFDAAVRGIFKIEAHAVGGFCLHPVQMGKAGGGHGEDDPAGELDGYRTLDAVGGVVPEPDLLDSPSAVVAGDVDVPLLHVDHMFQRYHVGLEDGDREVLVVHHDADLDEHAEEHADRGDDCEDTDLPPSVDDAGGGDADHEDQRRGHGQHEYPCG